MLGEVKPTDEERLVVSRAMLDHVPARGDGEPVDGMDLRPDGDLVRFPLERVFALANPVGERKQDWRPVAAGAGGIVGEVVARHDHPPDLAADREPEVEQVETVRRQDRGQGPARLVAQGDRRSARGGRSCRRGKPCLEDPRIRECEGDLDRDGSVDPELESLVLHDVGSISSVQDLEVISDRSRVATQGPTRRARGVVRHLLDDLARLVALEGASMTATIRPAARRRGAGDATRSRSWASAIECPSTLAAGRPAIGRPRRPSRRRRRPAVRYSGIRSASARRFTRLMYFDLMK